MRVEQKIAGDDLLAGIGGQAVDARQVGDGSLGRAADDTVLAVHRHTREVADVLVGAGQLVKKRRLAAVLVAGQREPERLAFGNFGPALAVMVAGGLAQLAHAGVGHRRVPCLAAGSAVRFVDIVHFDLGGISQPLIHYEAAFSRAQQAAERCNWRWVSESLRQLRASVDAFHARASHYHAGECLCQLAALNSRLNCAHEMAQRDSVGEIPPMPWRTVVGAGIAGEAKLDHLRLVSLGMRCWQDIEHYGLRIWFTDPDTGSILHLSRSWPRSEQENSPAATRRLFSFQAGALAGGQIVSQAAKRSADGELLLATRNRLSSVVPLSPDAWQMLSAPLRQPGIVALREYLRQRPPACIRPLNQVDNLFILPVAECISLGWDSSRQTLDAQVISGEGEDNLLTLSLPASASAPYAVERMAALLQQTDDPVCLVSGFVSFVDGQLTLEPQVMMTKTRAWALDAETAPVVVSLPSASVLPVPSTAHQLLMRCQALLIQLLHNGWRYQEQSAISQAELLANDLTAVGFYRLAHVLGQFRNTESEARVEAINNGVLLCEQLFPMLQQQG